MNSQNSVWDQIVLNLIRTGNQMRVFALDQLNAVHDFEHVVQKVHPRRAVRCSPHVLFPNQPDGSMHACQSKWNLKLSPSLESDHVLHEIDKHLNQRRHQDICPYLRLAMHRIHHAFEALGEIVGCIEECTLHFHVERMVQSHDWIRLDPEGSHNLSSDHLVHVLIQRADEIGSSQRDRIGHEGSGRDNDPVLVPTQSPFIIRTEKANRSVPCIAYVMLENSNSLEVSEHIYGKCVVNFPAGFLDLGRKNTAKFQSE